MPQFTTARRAAVLPIPMVLMLAVAVVVTSVLPAWTSPSSAAKPAGSPDSQTPTLVVQSDDIAKPRDHVPSGLTNRPKSGLVYDGMVRSKYCPGAFKLVGVDGERGCTTGPEDLGEQAPKDLAHSTPVAEERSAAELYQAAETTPEAAEAGAMGAVPCYGDGVTGNRVQAVYAVASDRTDRYDSVAPLVQSAYAVRTDAVYANSAARDGAVRHVRWVTTPDCKVDVIHAVLSPTGDDTLTNTRTELRNLGLIRTDRKYLVWVDATVYCGIGNVINDAQPGEANAANKGPTFGRIDSGCWGSTNAVEAHELGHTLGAVQLSAPHSNGSWHCTDEYDRMCYNDGAGTPVSYECASGGEALFDCHGDDYFNVNPAPTSWLADHWNVVNSVFLARTEPESEPSPTPTPTPTPTSASPSPRPTPSPTTSPTPTKTKGGAGRHRGKKNWSGELTRADPKQSYRFVSDRRGKVAVELDFARADKLHIVLKRDGRASQARYGQSQIRLVRETRADTYRLVVRGQPTKFRLAVNYPG